MQNLSIINFNVFVKVIFIKFFYVFLFIFLELKNNFSLIIKSLKIINEFTIKSLFLNFFFNSRIAFKNNYINKFINKNKAFNKKINLKNNNKILIELLLPHHLEPMIMNCLIGNDLSKYYGSNCVALINKNDLVTREIAKSYNIEEFIFINQENLIIKFFYFLKSLFLINYNSIDKNLYNLKLDGLEIGKSALEHYLRMHNYDPKNKNKFLLYLCLSKALIQAEFAKKVFKKKYKYFVIGETQFIPNKIFFHQSLKSKIPVYTFKGTAVYEFTGRIFNDFKDRNKIIMQYSKNLTKILINFFIKKNILKNLKKKDEIKKIGIETIWSDQKQKEILKFKSKNDFFRHFKLKKMKNVLIVPHAMSDNLFNNNWNIFHTAYHWFSETLNEIVKIQNVNWIIKPHPYEYKFKGITARKIFDDFDINKKNIIFLDENIHIQEIYKYVDVVITGNGSAGYEYPSLGIPAITTSDAAYSNFDFTVSPKNKKDYFKILKKINSLKKISSFKRKKAQIFWYSLLNLTNSHGLLPKIKQHGNFKKELFFKKISKKNFNKLKKNLFTQDIIHQLKFQNRHTINLEFMRKNKLKNKLFLNDI